MELICKFLSNEMYIKLIGKRISYGYITYFYEMARVIVVQVIFILLIAKLSYIKNVML